MADGAKRLRLEVGKPASQHLAAAEVAEILQKLQSLLGAGVEPDGLDSLLEELVRAQGGMNESITTQVAFKAIADAQDNLQAAIVALQAAVDRFTPPPGYQPPPAAGVDEAYVRNLLSYAHRLSYSSSAPIGYQPGQPLYFFKPPAPQEAEMRVSQLHAFNREWEERQQLLEAQRQAAVQSAAAAPAAVQPALSAPAAAAPVAALPAGGDVAAMAAKHGLDVQQLLASMPPGWKPGDPIPLGPAAPAAASAAPATEPAAEAPAAPAATAAPAAPPPQPPQAQQAAQQQQQQVPAEPATEEAEAPRAPPLAGIFLNQLNFAELEYGVSSGEEDSDEDDEDSDED